MFVLDLNICVKISTYITEKGWGEQVHKEYYDNANKDWVKFKQCYCQKTNCTNPSIKYLTHHDYIGHW